ncbi:MAG: cytochrome c [Candidatus Rokubacteria bacterium]|nr:cytochrome c [Candidatus Rokubacteria bacterium]
MRRALLALIAVLIAVGLFTGGLAALLETPAPPPGASRAERLYLGLCASCHGADGRGTLRATLFLIRPGDLTRIDRPDAYLFDIIKHGGAPIGRPGMPGFGTALSEDDIARLVHYIRTLPSAR